MGSRSHKNRKTASVVVALTAAATWGGGAHASGFALMEQNASGLGNAYAGQAAAAEDASTIFFNPAGMTYIGSRQIVGVVHAISPDTEFNDKGSTGPLPFPPPIGHPLGGDGGDAGDLAIVPNLYGSWEVIPGTVWVGLGFGAPFGLKTDYDKDWIGRFHGTKSEVKTININPSIAWKANETVSLGLGLNLQKFDAELANAVSYTAISGGLIPNSEGIATVEGDDWAWGWNAGIMINLTPATRVGISYRSTIEYDLEGDVSFKNRPAPLAALVPNGDIKAEVETPDSFSVALAHQFTPKLQLLADYTWTGWDSIQAIEIFRDNGVGLNRLELNMHDSWRMGVGLNYRLDDAWKLRAGMAYDRAAIRDGRTPRLPDEDRLWATIGAQWNVSKQTAIDFGYAYITTRGDADVNLPSMQTPTADFPTSLPRGNLVGDYDAKVHIFSVQARYSF